MDGEIVSAVQEERLSRVKNDASFPYKAIDYCLDSQGLTSKDIDAFAYYEQPYKKLQRLFCTYLHNAPNTYPLWDRSFHNTIKSKLNIKKKLKERYSCKNLIFSTHHKSHAASSFLTSPFEESAILTIDGVGEWQTTTMGVGRDTDLEVLKYLRFPDSVGLLYSAFTAFLGFKINSGEYKVMGLAPYGSPVYSDVILDNIVDLRDDGSIRVNPAYLNYIYGISMYSLKIMDILGPKRGPEEPLTQRHMDIAASIQKVTEDIVYKMASHLHNLTHSDNLCLAGGVALNCVSNGKLLRKGPFKNIWVQPASGDSGGAIGAALWAYHGFYGNPRKEKNSGFNVYLGPRYPELDIKNYLDRVGASYSYITLEDKYRLVAREISCGKVVGYFNGRMEYGPRSLGSRSILGDPRDTEMQTTLNLKIKKRESFRPFAPSVLLEHCRDFFDLGVPSPYMLLVAPVKDSLRLEVDYEGLGLISRIREKRSTIPAVTHIDYSARVHTVSKDTNEDYYNLISAFYELTGCPVLVNTSFNVRGEPIVCSPEDALNCFMKTSMDVLVLENFILYKERQDNKLFQELPNTLYGED